MDILELVRQCQNGQREPFGLLYDEFADRIFRYIKFKIHDAGTAEDLMQEVFIKAWRGLPSLPLENLNFSAWLYKIASNTMNDYFRKQYRQPQTAPLDERIDYQNALTNDEHTLPMDTNPLLAQAIKNLPVQYQEVLELRFVQDLTLQETAHILGKTNLAVRLLQHRALKQLRKALGNEDNKNYV